MKLTLKTNKTLNYLSYGSKRISGRNNQGRITRYHRGGGCKRNKRIIDYYRFIWNIYGLIIRIEYDPNRSALLALVAYTNGILSYIVAPHNLKVGNKIMNKKDYSPFIGYSTLLCNIPVGIKISNIELYLNKGSQYIRAAGSYATIISKAEKHVILKLKSGVLKKFSAFNLAVIGEVSNFDYIYVVHKKAGYYIKKGWRPVVRGVAMNPIDHPHGGGQGKTSGGRVSVTPWGKITKGQPTKKKLKEKNL